MLTQTTIEINGVKYPGDAAHTALAMEPAKLKEELAAYKVDAERYRWLRKTKGAKDYAICSWNGDETEGETGWYAIAFKDADIDSAIDAAMKEQA